MAHLLSRTVSVLVPVAGIAAGAMIAFWIFGTAFFSTSEHIFPQFAGPLASAALASFILALLNHRHWKLASLSVAGPVLLLCALLLVLLLAEGRADISWVEIAVVTFAFSWAAGWVAYRMMLLGLPLEDNPDRDHDEAKPQDHIPF